MSVRNCPFGCESFPEVTLAVVVGFLLGLLSGQFLDMLFRWLNG